METKTIVILAILASIALLPAIPHSQSGYGEEEGFTRTWCASGPFEFPGCSAGSGVYGWGLLSLLATLAVFFALVVIYMFGHAFSLENVKRFAVSEFFEVVASAAMIILIVFLLWEASSGGLFTFISESVLREGSTIVCGTKIRHVTDLGPLEVAKCKVQGKITQLDDIYQRIYDKNMKLETWGSTCLILFGVQVYCGDWSVHSVVEQAHLLGEKIVPLQVSLHGQYALLEYINENMLAVFLPLGILLRVLPLTRGLGGLLMAVAIGFYFVFPIVLVLTDPTFVRAPPSQVSPITSSQACFASFRGAVAVYNSFILPSIGDAQLSYGNWSELLVQLTVQILFYPFIAFAVAIVFIRSLTPVLGGDTGDIMRMVGKLV